MRLLRTQTFVALLIILLATAASATQPFAAESSHSSSGGSAVSTASSLLSNEAIPELILLLSVPGLSFQELAPETLNRLPALKALTASGKLAAMNIRTPERGIEDVYLSINAGAPALAPSEVQAYQAAVPTVPDATDDHAATRDQARSQQPVTEVLDQYARFTGNTGEDSRIIVPEIGNLKALNDSQTYAAQIGRLGDIMAANGVRTAVFGNRDYGDAKNSYAPFMLMDADGKVAEGDISGAVMTVDSGSPYGLRTNTRQIIHDIKELLDDRAQRSLEPVEAAGQGGFRSEQYGNGEVSSPLIVLVEYGDWYRLDQERKSYMPEQWEMAQRRELLKLDETIEQLAMLVNSRSRAQLWVFSPQPHAQAARDKLHLTPFILYEHLPLGASALETNAAEPFTAEMNGEETHAAEQLIIAGGNGPGLFTSPTTRRDGLLSLHDLGPTLLAAAAIEPGDGWTGLAAEAVERPDALRWLLNDVHKMRNVYELRTNVVIPFVTYEVIVLLLSLLMVLMGWRKSLRWMRLPLYSLLAAPLFILLLGFLPELDVGMQMAVLIAAISAFSIWCGLLSNQAAILLIAALNTVVLMIDGVLGANLMKYSVMGYDPMIGARYYGIGNEYMGVLVGSAILVVVLVLQRIEHRNDKAAARPADQSASDSALPPRYVRKPTAISRGWLKVGAALWFLAITFYMAAPQGGTNAGGALTASAAFGIVWLRMFGKQPIRQVHIIRLLIVVCGLLLAGLLLLWAMNQWLSGDGASGNSHIGRAMDILSDGRLDLIMGIIVRKLQMNLSLIGVSSWGKVLLTSIFVLAVLLLRPRGLLRKWQETRPYWMSGFTAIIIGSIVALALNDSGIVAAGTMIIFAAVPILLLISEHERKARAG